jgi:RES domain-containing protein
MGFRSKLPLRAFRIADSRHPVFDSTGAFLKGGRWTSPGKRVIYAAQTYAGALLEVLVHLSFVEVPSAYQWIELSLSGEQEVEQITSSEVRDWNTGDFTAARSFGDLWYEEKRSIALLVPSVVTAGVENNVLINQEHSCFSEIEASAARDVIWDARLFGPAESPFSRPPASKPA